MIDYEETKEDAILSFEQQIKQLVKDAFDKGYQCGYKDRKNEPQEGEWIEMGQNENGTHNVKCNQCDNSYKIHGHAKSIYTRYNYKFCPHCGARMKGADDETAIS